MNANEPRPRAVLPKCPPVLQGEAKAEWRILRDLAAAAWPERAHLLGCESGPAIREEIARIVPFYAGCEKLKKTGDAIQWGGERLCDDGAFATPDGKAHFKVMAVPPAAARNDQGPISNDQTHGAGHWSLVIGHSLFTVSTRRGKQFNTLIYDEIDPLTGAQRDAVFIAPEDAAELHLSRGDRITLVNETGRLVCTVFPAPIARGNLQVHWPEGNAILPRGRVDPNSGVPDYQSTVRIERVS